MPITTDGSQVLSVATLTNKVGYKIENATTVNLQVVLSQTAVSAFDISLYASADGSNFLPAYMDDAAAPLAKISIGASESTGKTKFGTKAEWPYFAAIVTGAKAGGGSATIFISAWHETLTPKITPLQWNQSQA